MDFYCPSEKIAVELDGAHHFTKEGYEYDLERDKYLSSLGIMVLRFENRLVLSHPDEILERIKNAFVTPPPCVPP